ncbi:MAG: DUF4845 domain-containing protein [Lamprocystis purpurea]|jgi:hypothetical protein|uniref:DUF4845 domain-containing protein n=1 Tax=Lamprocystis purpurea TaxID=61598 RepID=UPI000369264F|nr:DUF4845 domain-containing protein [Lamprocystis purpurea]MBV5275508.1 DUF4845 domain-containing protein [Lamprocystis purpurea]
MPGMRAVQQGMGMSAILFVLVVVIFAMTLLFKLGPSYMSFFTLKSIMNSVAESPEPILGGKPAVMRQVENQMMVNDVRSVDSKAFTVKKSGENTLDLTVDYEQRTHIFANVDAVLTFKHTVVVKGR